MATVTLHWQKRKKGEVGYLIIRGMGKPVWENIGLRLSGNKKSDKEIIESAERIRARRLIEIAESGYDLPLMRESKDFLSYYKKVIDERPEYERRAAVYKNLTSYCRDKKINVTFRELGEGFWNKFKTYLIEEKRHGQYTIHTVLSILKAILNKAVRERVINKNPLQYVKEKRPKSNRTYLTIEEVRKLKNTPCGNEEIKKAFLFDFYNGLRKGDLKELKKKNIVNNEIIIRMEKTKEILRIPLAKNAQEYLPNLEMMDPDERIFKLPAWSTVSITIKDWALAAGINKRVTPHSFRHSYATSLLTYGASIESVRDLLGHKDVRETQIYAKIIDELKRKAVDNLPEL